MSPIKKKNTIMTIYSHVHKSAYSRIESQQFISNLVHPCLLAKPPVRFLEMLSGHRHNHQWKVQDPKIEVLYHIRPYFLGIFPYIGLIYGRYLEFRFLKFPLIMAHLGCLSYAYALNALAVAGHWNSPWEMAEH